MSALFLDTSYLIALLRRKDALHERAVALQRNTSLERLVTTEYVIVEFLDAMSAVSLRRAAHSAVSELEASGAVEIVPATPALLQEAVAMYAQYADKEWGLTDCASFCVMRGRGLTAALSADRHFEQAGFQALLRGNGRVS